jgi:hypothetical protein
MDCTPPIDVGKDCIPPIDVGIDTIAILSKPEKESYFTLQEKKDIYCLHSKCLHEKGSRTPEEHYKHLKEHHDGKDVNRDISCQSCWKKYDPKYDFSIEGDKVSLCLSCIESLCCRCIHDDNFYETVFVDGGDIKYPIDYRNEAHYMEGKEIDTIAIWRANDWMDV